MGEQTAISLDGSDGIKLDSQHGNSVNLWNESLAEDVKTIHDYTNQSVDDTASEYFGNLELANQRPGFEDPFEGDLPDKLVEIEKESQSLHRIKVEAGGRQIDSTILLPDDYDSSKEYPVVLGIHSYPGDGDGMGELIKAEKLRDQGVIVVLPSAESGMWESNKVDGISYFSNPFVEGHDDIEAIKETLDVVEELYGIDKGDVNIVAHGQGVPVGIELSRQMDQNQPGAINRLFMTAGSMANIDAQSIDLSGTDLIHYEPEKDWIQDFGNFITGTSGSEEFFPKIIDAKNCNMSTFRPLGNVGYSEYRCEDGSSIQRMFEREGEMAYPGQPQKFDGIFGAGSTSQVDMTEIVIELINTERVLRSL